MQKIGHQDSSSPQSQVRSITFKLCLDLSLKARPLRKGPLNITTEQSKSHCGSQVIVDTHKLHIETALCWIVHISQSSFI